MEKQSINNQVSLIIPCYNEEKRIGKLLRQIQQEGFEKVIVVDGGSIDRTLKVIANFEVEIIHSSKKGRAVQMNIGAQHLNTDYLLFLHADVTLPDNFYRLIKNSIEREFFDLANFKLQFDSNHWFLNWNAVFSRFKFGAFQFGDQGLLIKRDLFKKTNGYDETLQFMEGNEIIRKLRKKYVFNKLDIRLIVSDRKYKKYGVFKLQFSYYAIYLLKRLGFAQTKINHLFKKILN